MSMPEKFVDKGKEAIMRALFLELKGHQGLDFNKIKRTDTILSVVNDSRKTPYNVSSRELVLDLNTGLHVDAMGIYQIPPRLGN